MSDLLLTACRLTCVHMCMWFWDETGLRVFLGTENWLFLATALWVAFMVCGISFRGISDIKRLDDVCKVPMEHGLYICVYVVVQVS